MPWAKPSSRLARQGRAEAGPRGDQRHRSGHEHLGDAGDAKGGLHARGRVRCGPGACSLSPHICLREAGLAIAPLKNLYAYVARVAVRTAVPEALIASGPAGTQD